MECSWILNTSGLLHSKWSPGLHVNFARDPKYSWFHEHSKKLIYCLYLAYLSRKLMGELIVYQSLWRPSVVRLSIHPSIHPNLQTSSLLKPLGQLNSNFIWRLLRTRERKFVQMALVTGPRWPPRPYMVKPLKNLFFRTRMPWDLVCSIGVVGPTKFVQMRILDWPWPTKLQGQIFLPNAFWWENF